ncbi:unnamed protein product [Leuciscus chuanchicus]
MKLRFHNRNFTSPNLIRQPLGKETPLSYFALNLVLWNSDPRAPASVYFRRIPRVVVGTRDSFPCSCSGSCRGPLLKWINMSAGQHRVASSKGICQRYAALQQEIHKRNLPVLHSFSFVSVRNSGYFFSQGDSRMHREPLESLVVSAAEVCKI